MKGFFGTVFVVSLAATGFSQQPELRLPWADGGRYALAQGPGGSYSHNTTFTQYDVDFMMPEGTVIIAAAAGTVKNTTTNSSGYGNFVKIDHGNGLFTIYGHLKDNGFSVLNGTYVAQGTPIGLSGNTGYSSAPHLHFGLHSGSATNSTGGESVLATSIWAKDYTVGGAFRFFSTRITSPEFIENHEYQSGPLLQPFAVFTSSPPQNRWYKSTGPVTRLNYSVGGGTPNEVQELDWLTGNPPPTIFPYSNIESGFIELHYAGVGWHEYEVRARRDGASAWVYSGRWIGGFDDVGPTASRTGGALPGVWLRGTQTVTYTGADAHSGFKDSQFGFGSYNSGNWSPTNPRVVSIPTTTGEYTLMVEVADQSWADSTNHTGNSGIFNLGTYKIDNTNPVPSLTSVNPPSGGSAGGVQIAVAGTDSHSGMNRIEVRVNGTLVGTVTGATGTVTWNSTGYPATCTIEAKAIDNAGNEGTTSQAYQNDSSAPLTPVIQDEGVSTSSSSTLGFAVQVSDPESGVTLYEYKLGTTPGSGDLRSPVTINPVAPNVVVGNLALTVGQTAYLSVRAQNPLGLWSSWGSSNGITYLPFGQNERVIAGVVASGGNWPTLQGTAAQPLGWQRTSGFWTQASTATMYGKFPDGSYIPPPGAAKLRIDVVQNGSWVDRRMATVLAGGLFEADFDAIGDCTLFVSAAHCLIKRVDGVDLGTSNPAHASVILENGDVNGDNQINRADLAALQAAMGTSIGQPGYNPNADVNDDGVINRSDAAIVSGNQGALGDRG